MDISSLESENLYFVPLGGSEQFGVNLNVYIYKGRILIVDCGLGFADERFPGIDLLLPDPAFLEENRDRIDAIIITHAHEDHVGAVPYLWKRLKCPVFCSPFTAKVLERKFKEFGIDREVNLQIIRHSKNSQHQYKDIGAFKVRMIDVAHSIPDSKSLVIETEYGKIVHSGDWNLDPKPVIGNKTDENAFRTLGEEGVLAYVGDSTNAGIAGRAGSESDVQEGLKKLFAECKGKIAVTMFASNVSRILSIYQAAKANNRVVAIMGRSLFSMVESARACGYLKNVPEFLTVDDIEGIKDENLVIIITGSQGEAKAALSRVARGAIKQLKLGKGDSVIFSARPIPGNEKDINHVQNMIVSSGAKVVTAKSTPHNIHISGHPYRDEVIEMHGWLKPNIIIPVHGERMQIENHAELARESGAKTIIPENGSVIKLAPQEAEICGKIETGVLAVDQACILPVGHSSISARRKLQYTGFIHATVLLNSRGEVLEGSKVSSEGLPHAEGENIEDLNEAILDEISELVSEIPWEELENENLVTEKIRTGIRRYCVRICGLKPSTNVHLVLM